MEGETLRRIAALFTPEYQHFKSVKDAADIAEAQYKTLHIGNGEVYESTKQAKQRMISAQAEYKEMVEKHPEFVNLELEARKMLDETELKGLDISNNESARTVIHLLYSKIMEKVIVDHDKQIKAILEMIKTMNESIHALSMMHRKE